MYRMNSMALPKKYLPMIISGKFINIVKVVAKAPRILKMMRALLLPFWRRNHHEPGFDDQSPPDPTVYFICII